MTVSPLLKIFHILFFSLHRLAPPEWIAPLHVKVEADERLMEVGALPGDREPLIFDVSADTTAGCS